jgi:phospholipase/carboxylesterase
VIHQFVPAKSGDLTVLLLHGTGGDEHDLLPIGRAVAPGAALLSPRGNVLEDGARRFFRRLSPGVFDEADIRIRAQELADFVSQFQGGRLMALGYSNGANIAAALMLLHPGLLKGAVLLRPMIPLVPNVLPDLTGTRVQIQAGMEDDMTTPQNTEGLAKLLSGAGSAVEVRWMDAGHDLGPGDFQAAKEFFAAAG